MWQSWKGENWHHLCLTAKGPLHGDGRRGAGRGLVWCAQVQGPGPRRPSHPPGTSNCKRMMRKLIFCPFLTSCKRYGPKGPLSVTNQKLGVCGAHPCLQCPHDWKQAGWKNSLIATRPQKCNGHRMVQTCAILGERPGSYGPRGCQPLTNGHDSSLKFYFLFTVNTIISSRATARNASLTILTYALPIGHCW